MTQITSESISSPRVVELACGAGYLAEVLLRQLPTARYCGFDLSPHLLGYARRRLTACATPSGKPSEIELRCADLVRADWQEELMGMGWVGRVDAVISLQALHDLGGFPQQTSVLARARELLRPGGRLIYSDLLLDAEDPHPSRFTAARHAEMLHAAGFTPDDVATPAVSDATVRFGDFGCFRCRR